jgi:hypothetical protein
MVFQFGKRKILSDHFNSKSSNGPGKSVKNDDIIFSPFQEKNFTVKNRIGVAPMTRLFSSGHIIPRQDVFDLLMTLYSNYPPLRALLISVQLPEPAIMISVSIAVALKILEKYSGKMALSNSLNEIILRQFYFYLLFFRLINVRLFASVIFQICHARHICYNKSLFLFSLRVLRIHRRSDQSKSHHPGIRIHRFHIHRPNPLHKIFHIRT